MGEALDWIGTSPGTLARRSLITAGLAMMVLPGTAETWRAGRLRIGVPDDIHPDVLAAVTAVLRKRGDRRPAFGPRRPIPAPEFQAFPTWGGLIDHATLPDGFEGAVLPWGMLPALRSAAADPRQWGAPLRLDDIAPGGRVVLLLSPDLARRGGAWSAGRTLVIGRPLGLPPDAGELRALLNRLGHDPRGVTLVDLPARDLAGNTRSNLLDAAIVTGWSAGETVGPDHGGSPCPGSAQDGASAHPMGSHGIASEALVPPPALYLRRRPPGQPQA